MKRMSWTTLGGIMAMLLLTGADAPQPLVFPLHHFSIQPLEARANGKMATLLAMCLPESNGFAPNVSILSQPLAVTMDQYIAISKSQFDQQHWTVVSLTKLNDKTAVMEYTGLFGGQQLHWYAKCVRTSDEFILATATATNQQWPKDEQKLKACVDSLQQLGQ